MLALAFASGLPLSAGGGLGAGVSLAFGGGGMLGSAGVVCAGVFALAVGGRMNLFGIW